MVLELVVIDIKFIFIYMQLLLFLSSHHKYQTVVMLSLKLTLSLQKRLFSIKKPSLFCLADVPYRQIHIYKIESYQSVKPSTMSKKCKT